MDCKSSWLLLFVASNFIAWNFKRNSFSRERTEKVVLYIFQSIVLIHLFFNRNKKFLQSCHVYFSIYLSSVNLISLEIEYSLEININILPVKKIIKPIINILKLAQTSPSYLIISYKNIIFVQKSSNQLSIFSNFLKLLQTSPSYLMNTLLTYFIVNSSSKRNLSQSRKKMNTGYLRKGDRRNILLTFH